MSHGHRKFSQELYQPREWWCQPPEGHEYDPDLEWAIAIAGGTVKGACGVTTIERHLEGFGMPDGAAGCSIGANEVVSLSQGEPEDIRATYEQVKSTRFFQKSNMPWRIRRVMNMGGMFNFKPLKAILYDRCDLTKNSIPPERVFLEMFDAERMRPVQLSKSDLVSDEHYVTAVLASSSQPLIHEFQRVYLPDVGKPTICIDGGVENTIPDLPEWWRYRNIRVLLNSPIDRRADVDPDSVDSWFEMASRVFDLFMAHISEKNMRRIQMWADFGVNVIVHAPGPDIGGSFDASKEMMSERLGPIGDYVWENPITLKPGS